jgi:hypothetical protein
MNSTQRLITCSFVLLLCITPAMLYGQTAAAERCFSIHVRLNGKRVDGPRTVTFKTREREEKVSLEGGCFTVPRDLLQEKTLDVFFAIPGNKVYLGSIATGFYAGPWDVDLADKRFTGDVHLPKHTRAKDACAIVFHVGEPEIQAAMSPCRSPSRPERVINRKSK